MVPHHNPRRKRVLPSTPHLPLPSASPCHHPSVLASMINVRRNPSNNNNSNTRAASCNHRRRHNSNNNHSNRRSDRRPPNNNSNRIICKNRSRRHSLRRCIRSRRPNSAIRRRLCVRRLMRDRPTHSNSRPSCIRAVVVVVVGQDNHKRRKHNALTSSQVSRSRRITQACRRCRTAGRCRR